jgi:hypothetical protein
MSPACHLGPAILELVAALRSPEARKFVQDTYHGARIDDVLKHAMRRRDLLSAGGAFLAGQALAQLNEKPICAPMMRLP